MIKNALTRLTSKSAKPWGGLARIITVFAPYHLLIATSLASLFCLAVLFMEVVQ